MDRWEGRDGDDLGDEDVGVTQRRKRAGLPGLRSVSRHGLAGFVTSTSTSKASAPDSQAKAPDAAQADATLVMPSKQVLSKLPGNFKAPAWAATAAPQGASLDVRKNNASLLRIELSRGVTVLGRHPDADVMLDHASVSRFHAALVFDREGKLTCIDNISAHGTFVNGRQLKQVRPGGSARTFRDPPAGLQRSSIAQMTPPGSCGFADAPRPSVRKGGSTLVPQGSTVQFGASTRTYIFEQQVQAPPSSQDPTAGNKRPRGQSSQQEAVLGSIDRRTVTPGVGPKRAQGGEAGAFQNAVRTVTIPSAGDGPQKSAKSSPAGNAATTPKLKALMSDLKKASKSSSPDALQSEKAPEGAAAPSGSRRETDASPSSRRSGRLYDSLE